MNSPNKPNLSNAKTITLVRCPNGWLMHGDLVATHINVDHPVFAFESTQSLAKQLVDLVGESGWKVTAATPARDAKGHFIKKSSAQ